MMLQYTFETIQYLRYCSQGQGELKGVVDFHGGCQCFDPTQVSLTIMTKNNYFVRYCQF